jgi:hypothetical protein
VQTIWDRERQRGGQDGIDLCQMRRHLVLQTAAQPLRPEVWMYVSSMRQLPQTGRLRR